MVKTLGAMTLALGLMLSLAGSAAAATGPELSIVREAGTAWSLAHVGEDAGAVTIRVFAPKGSGSGRELWQRCSFADAGAGTYTCGVDVSPGSAAAARAGHWVAKVFVEGSAWAVAKERFNI